MTTGQNKTKEKMRVDDAKQEGKRQKGSSPPWPKFVAAGHSYIRLVHHLLIS